MGQYHTVYNLDKKEYFSLAGAKLWEKAYSPLHSMALNVLLCNSNGRGGGDLCNPIHKDAHTKKFTSWNRKKHTKAEYDAIEAALKHVSGRWAGDRILIQGDYAEKGDAAFQDKENLNEYVDITRKVAILFKLVQDVDPDEDIQKHLEFEMKFRGL